MRPGIKSNKKIKSLIEFYDQIKNSYKNFPDEKGYFGKFGVDMFQRH